MGAIGDILKKFGDDTVSIIKNNMSLTGTDASGQTSQSLESNLIGEFRVKVIGRPFFMTVETGRKPGRMPPVSKIQAWLETGKVTFTGKIESVAWAISKSIARSGTQLHQLGGRTDIVTPALSDVRINKLVEDIANETLERTINVIERATDGTER